MCVTTHAYFMYRCVCIYTHARRHVHVYIHICECMRTHMCVSTFLIYYQTIAKHTYVYWIYVYAYVYVYMYMCIYIYVYVYTHTYIYIYICTRANLWLYSHKRSPLRGDNSRRFTAVTKQSPKSPNPRTRRLNRWVCI